MTAQLSQNRPALSRLKILFLFHRLPLKEQRPDQEVVREILEFLKRRGHSVDLITLQTTEKVSDEGVAELKALCETCNIVKQTPFESFAGKLTGALRGWPEFVGKLYNNELFKVLTECLQTKKYDVAVCYGLPFAGYLPALKKRIQKISRPHLPTVMVLNGTISMAARSRLAAQRQGFDILSLSAEYGKIKRYEAKQASQYSTLVVTGAADQREIIANCKEFNFTPPQEFGHVAYGIDDASWAPLEGVPQLSNNLVFSGFLPRPENAEAVEWFIQNVWPEVHEFEPTATFTVIGRGARTISKLANPAKGIQILDEMDYDPKEILHKATVCVNPVPVAMGRQAKMLKYMAMGKAIVTTAQGRLGIDGVNMEHFIVAEHPEEFAETILKLFRNPELREQLGGSARRFAQQWLGWERNLLQMEYYFQSAKDL